jgi:subfamily B ATP-binding cassette protein HlyB/CyaB
MPHLNESAEKLDTELACLVIMARFYEFAADEKQLTHQFAVSGENFTEQEILLASKTMGLKSRAVKRTVKQLSQVHLPAIARHVDGIG